MATFVSGFVVGFTAVWQLALVTLVVVPIIAVIGCFNSVTLAKLSSNIVEQVRLKGPLCDHYVGLCVFCFWVVLILG